MKESRKRKTRSRKGSLSTTRSHCKADNGNVGEKNEWQFTWWTAGYLSVGFLLALCHGYVYFQHTRQLHENELWFSHINVSSFSKLHGLNIFWVSRSMRYIYLLCAGGGKRGFISH